ncbi:maltose ABC transporter substrate-binding protein [Sulfobacillus thermosulfidooxidans]|uniref:sugar ABC transporter substrate-binding protein n=1 Tax=Sulfobacillus thermosulfidooxidans TaxID=28034 RepID=UPI0006B69DE4|nr:maltose ABC transporter substrate-binding protein [Sulfobacillus thermosulfidooxidans]
MMKNKIIVVGAAMSFLTASLAGCGSAPTTTNASSSSSTAIPKGQTITVWSWQGGPIYNQVVKIADAWAKAHGDTVKVVNQSNNPNGFQFYATAARSGKGPDVVFGMPHDNNGLFAEEGLISPVPQGDFNPADYNSSVDEAVTINDKVYSLPDFVQTTALYYNKSMIKTPPQTWAQFVHDANKYGFMYPQHNLYFNFAVIGGMGGYVFKYQNGKLDPQNIGLNTPGAIQGFTLMRDMDSKYHWMTPSTDSAVSLSKFTAGKIGMTINGPWDIPSFQAAKIPFGVAPLPTLPNGHPMTPFLGVITTFVNARSPYQAADWSLAKALSSSNAQMEYFKLEQQIPALTSLRESPTIQNNASFKAFSDEVRYAVPMPNIPQMQAVWSAMSVIEDIINGKLTPTTGANDFVKDIKQGIKVAQS